MSAQAQHFPQFRDARPKVEMVQFGISLLLLAQSLLLLPAQRCSETAQGQSLLQRRAGASGEQGTGNTSAATPPKNGCMLVPVYEPHFQALAARLKMTHRMNTGPVVKTVAVFGSREEEKAFCAEYGDACQRDTGYHGIDLETILGKEAFHRLQVDLHMTEGGEQPAPPLAEPGRHGCWTKTEGRVFQTVKKFYGAAYGPKECTHYWVTDAESVPFAQHDLHALINRAENAIVASSWHDDPRCSAFENPLEGQNCAYMLTTLTDGLRSPGDTAPSMFTEHYWKQIFNWFDQWWTYEPKTVDMFLQLIHKSMGKQGSDAISFLRVSDHALWGAMMFWAANYEAKAGVTYFNVREELKKLNSEVFEKCCSCQAEGTLCSSSSDVVGSPCLQEIPLQDRVSLLIDKLHVWGFSNYLRWAAVPDEALGMTSKDGHRFAWCYNNCFKPEVYDRFMRLPGTDKEALEEVREAFFNTKALSQFSNITRLQH